MNRFLAFSLAVLITPVVAKADFVIDDFRDAETLTLSGTSGTTLSLEVQPGVNRTVTVTSPGFATFTTAEASGVGTLTASGSVDSTVAFNYIFDNSVDLHSIGISNPVRLGAFTNFTGDWRVDLKYTSDAPGAGPALSFTQVVLSTGTLWFDGRTLGNGLLASNVKEIELLFTVIDQNGLLPATFRLEGDFVATPEPASLALAGFAVSSLGASGFLRRRRRQAVAQDISV
jgi:hypothetical protein